MATLEELQAEYNQLKTPAAKQRYAALVGRAFQDCLNEMNEAALTPQIKFKIAEPTAQPEPPDTESAVRQFFRDHPETREIKVGNITYQR